jgi:ribose 5-phosphate isomerase A
MVVGLGHGSTTVFALRRIAELLQQRELQDILGIPTSTHVERDARKLGIPLTTLEEHSRIDLTIDGADEVDDDLNLIKGGGGALLREKIVAQASRREIIVVDQTKLSPTLGIQWPVPVEVVPFGWRSQSGYLESLGAQVTLRRGEGRSPFHTDQGNLILDCDFGAMSNPEQLALRLKERAGIVEHGMFIGLASDVIVGTDEGIRHLRKQDVKRRAQREP